MFTHSRISLLLLTTLFFLAAGCASSDITREGKKLHIGFQAGINKGGITENTVMADITDAGPDAFTGATRRGMNVGARASVPLGAISLETGIDYMYNGQTFSWNDPVNGYWGTRNFGTHQLMWPFTLNFSLLRRQHPQGIIQLKLGHLLQYNMLNLHNQQGLLPNYTFNSWSNGLTFGIAVIPFTLGNGARLGVFTEVYRGSQIYKDHYNRPEFETPGSSFAKFGVIYQIN